MKHLGDFDPGAVLYGKFTTYRPSTGAPFTLAGTPAVSVYKDNSTTQSTTGVTLTVDFDSVTGLHHVAIDTSADGTFYSAGSFFSIVVTAGTVDSISAVGTVVAEFTIRKSSALKPATPGRTLVVDAAGLADANAVKLGPSGSGTTQTARDIGASVLLSSGTGTGQIALASGAITVGTNNDKTGYALSGTQTFNVTGNITGNVSGSVGSVTGNVGGNVTGSVGSVVGTVTVGTNNDKTGYALSGTQTFNVTGNITGNVSGSVGSVTGNVGGNVTGSVGSVVGSVGSVVGTVTVGTNNDKTGYALSGTQTFNVTGNITGNVSGSVGSVTGNVGGNVVGSVASVSGLSTASIAAAVLTTQMTESYAANGTAPTLAQALFAIHQYQMCFAITGTTYAVKKLDTTTGAFDVTLNDATNPTSALRA